MLAPSETSVSFSHPEPQEVTSVEKPNKENRNLIQDQPSEPKEAEKQKEELFSFTEEAAEVEECPVESLSFITDDADIAEIPAIAQGNEPSSVEFFSFVEVDEEVKPEPIDPASSASTKAAPVSLKKDDEKDKSVLSKRKQKTKNQKREGCRKS